MAQPTYNPASTFSVNTTANTFADWLNTTNKLVLQNNDLAANDFYKSTGTLHLNDPLLGLTVGSNTSLGNTLITSAVIQSLVVPTSLTVTGSTYYQSNTFLVNANNIYNINGSYGVYRPSGTNAQLRWNENGGNGYWDVLDVNNTNTSGAYSRILTANIVSSSLTSTSTSTLATSNTVNMLYNMVLSTTAGASNTFIGTSNTYANPINGVMIFKSNTGMSIIGNGDILYLNEGQNITNTATPTFSGLNLSSPLTIVNGGTGANTATGILNNILPSSGQISGYALSTNGAGVYYWGPGAGGGGSSGNVIKTNRQYTTTIANQTIIGAPTYTMGAGQLCVYINGVRQYATAYTESSNTTFTLTTPASSGDLVMAEVNAYTSAFYANNTPYSANVQYLGLAATTIQTAIDGTLGLLSSVWSEANSAYAQANAAFAAANNVAPQIAPTSNTANAAFIQANAVFSLANTLSSTITSGVVSTITGTPNQISANSSTGNILLSLPQSIATTSNVQFASVGVGTTPDSANTGSIRAINNITAYYSDDRLKTRLGNIDGALDKLMSLNGFYYEANQTAQDLGYAVRQEVGVSAQEVQAVLPEVVVPAPIDDKYLTVHYERLIPLVIEAIKELKQEVNEIKGLIK